MIRIQDLQGPASVARMSAEYSASETPPFQAVCTLEWETPSVVWVHGLLGLGNRRLWREFVAELDGRGVEFLRATRAEGHRLPRAVLLADGSYQMRVADLKARPIDSVFGSL